MDLYDKCQKILCVDGESNILLPDFTVCKVKRPRNLFNWAEAWKTGIEKATSEKILYLDSDRILPTNYLVELEKTIKDARFVYSSNLVRLTRDYNLSQIRNIRDGKIDYAHEKDRRLPHPPNMDVVSLGKNPFSGNTAFTKKTYKDTGGVDPCYEGWGYPDTDYYLRTYKAGYEFFAINCTELHLLHPYSVETKLLKLMNLWNGSRMAKKFKMQLDQSLINRMKEYNITQERLEKYETLDEFITYLERKNVKL